VRSLPCPAGSGHGHTGVLYLGGPPQLGTGGRDEQGGGGHHCGEDDILEEGGPLVKVVSGRVLTQGAPQGVVFGGEILERGGEGVPVGLFPVEMGFGAREVRIGV
jgi:hypothetical protein